MTDLRVLLCMSGNTEIAGVVACRRALYAFASTILVICTATGTAWSKEPGEKRMLDLKADKGSIRLTFAYVPSGTATPYTVDSGQAPQELPLPFFIMTTEASVELFDGYAPPEARKSHAEREQENGGELLQPDIQQRHAKGSEYAVVWCTLREIAKLTSKINIELESQRTTASIVQERVRLPTLAEWRHAMSVGSSPEAGFFNSWPRFIDLSAKDQGMCKDVWAICGGAGNFEGSPAQILWLLNNPGPETNRCYDIATLFTKHLIAGREVSGVQPWAKPVDPFDARETLTASAPNKWGIFGAHRNPCPEWVIGNDSQNVALSRWRRLESEEVKQDERGSPAFALCGPRFRLITREKLERFAELTIWSVPEFVLLKDDESKAVDRKPAFRLVLAESLADDWLQLVRKSLLDSASLAEAGKVADDMISEVQRLTSAASRDTAMIYAFLALREYDVADTSKTTENLGPLLAIVKPSGKAKVDFAAIRRGESGVKQEKQSPDAMYLNTLVSLLKRDSARMAE